MNLKNEIIEKSKGKVALLWPLIILLAISLVLRLAGLGERSYFNDELSALYRLQADNFSELIENGVKPDYHPAGVQVFLYYWARIAGDHPFMLRLPFALAGVISVWLLFLLGTRWFGRTTAWLAASSLALLQFPLLYSQLARPYSTGLLWVLAGTFFWDKLIFSDNSSFRHRIWYAAGLAIAFALAMYNHYFSFLVAGMIGITGLLFIKRKNLILYLFAGIAALLLFLPHLNVSIEQVSRGGLSTWLAPPDNYWIPEHIRYIFNKSWWVFGLFMIIALPLLIKPVKDNAQDTTGGRQNRFRALSITWYLFPLAFAWIYSVKINPILQNPIMLFSLPFLLLFLFSGYKSDNSHLTRFIAVLLPLMLIVNLFVHGNFYRETHYADFDTITSEICRISSETSDLVWAADVNNPWYLHYYLDKKCKPDSALFYSFSDREKLPELISQLDSMQATNFVYTWLRPADPAIPSLIRNFFPYLHHYYDSNGYGELFHFSKNPAESKVTGYNRDSLMLILFPAGTAQYIIGADDEYFNIYRNHPDFSREMQPVLIHCRLKGNPENFPDEIHLVITTTKPDGTEDSWNGIKLSLLQNQTGNYCFTTQLPASFAGGDGINAYLWNPKRECFPIEEIGLWMITKSKR